VARDCGYQPPCRANGGGKLFQPSAPYPPPASRCAVLRRAASPAGDCGPLENLTRESDLMRGLAPIVQKATCYPAQSL